MLVLEEKSSAKPRDSFRITFEISIGHSPFVSPCFRCAGNAFFETLMVCALSGFPGGM